MPLQLQYLTNFCRLELYVVAAISTVFLYYVVPYVVDPRRLRAYPGPAIARFSTSWMAWITFSGHILTSIHEQHKKYGPFVRIAPNHISISDPAAIQVVYGHGGNTLKSDFYEAFHQFPRTTNVFNTRSRPEHARKRKIMAHSLSQKNVIQFEPIIVEYQRVVMQYWDELCAAAAKGISGTKGSCTWRASGGRAWFDSLIWFNYLAFDVIGDLSFGSPFGMLAAVQDTARVIKSQEAAIRSVDLTNASDANSGTALNLELGNIRAVETINRRGDFIALLAVLPAWLRPIAALSPWLNKGSEAAKAMGAMAVTAVAKRLAAPTGRMDFLTSLLEGKSDRGLPLSTKELSAEAFVLLVAGSDTMSNSTCAITYHLARNQHVQAKLQHELDQALGAPKTYGTEDNIQIPQHSQLNKLPYLRAVIDEGLRLHSTVGLGLPRVVSNVGLTVLGNSFAPGTVLSVPTFTTHRDKSVWGDDADSFNPDRWFKEDKDSMQKAFAPFSFGPRACLGRNLASLELLIFIASIFHRYEITLENPEQELEVTEGLIRKPVDCVVGVKRRF